MPSGTPKRRSAEMAAEIAAQLMWGPKTAHAVQLAVAPQSHTRDLVQKYIDEFVASGCAYQSGKSAHHAPIYTWNAKPFAHLDPPPAGVSR